MRLFLSLLLVTLSVLVPENTLLAQNVIDPFTAFPLPSETVLNLVIAADIDDGTDADGVWNGGLDDLLAGKLTAIVGDVGLRFTGCNIPSGATVSVATLTVEVVTISGAGGIIIVQGQDVNNAGTWNGVGPATMAVTTANITRTLNTVQTEVFTVTAIVQEIIDNNAGIGGAIAIGILDNGSGFNNHSLIEAREAAGTADATLDITYTS